MLRQINKSLGTQAEEYLISRRLRRDSANNNFSNATISKSLHGLHALGSAPELAYLPFI